MPEPLLTVKDVAARLQVSEGTARTIILQLKYTRIGRLLRLRADLLERYIAQGGTPWQAHEYRRAAVEPAEPPATADKFALLRERYGKKGGDKAGKSGQQRSVLASRRSRVRMPRK